MKHAYVYVLDTLADWELGYVMAELNSGQYFKNQGARLPIMIVGATKEPITTKGGMKIIPDTTIDAITPEMTAVLLLPGADTWHDPKHTPIIEKARALLDSNATIGAICGATSALANAGIFDTRPHTSNSLDYLKMTCPQYHGERWYKDEKAVADGNLITASSAGGLLFARHILARLEVFSEDTLAAWYHYFDTGEADYFSALMQTLPQQPAAAA